MRSKQKAAEFKPQGVTVNRAGRHARSWERLGMTVAWESGKRGS